MLALQSTILLPPFPIALQSPVTHSVLVESTTKFDTIGEEDCQGLAGVRAMLLDVHLEGNLGDEMETTPLLQELKRCNVSVTAVLSQWLKGKENQLGFRSVREHALIDTVIPSPPGNSYDRIMEEVAKDHDAVILAPGPWMICHLSDYWPYRIDVFMSGSIIFQDETCNLTERLSLWGPSLVAVREPYSFDLLHEAIPGQAKTSLLASTPSLSWTDNAVMSGDLTYSFEPAKGTLDYWKRVYASYRKRTLVFVRASNADNILSIRGATVELTTLFVNKVSLPSNTLVFATSSSLEDSLWMQKWKQLYPHFQDHQFVECGTVEQLFGLISQAKHVYTDRYHPGVAAHLFNTPFTVLDYRQERGKLIGLYKIVSNQITPQTIRNNYNQQAFQLLRDTLRRLKNQPRNERRTNKALLSPVSPAIPIVNTRQQEKDLEQPHAIVVGLPKSGTTSVYHFFSCSGYQTTHYCCCGTDATEFPCTGGLQFSDKLQHNIRSGRPLWEGTGNNYVHAQLDGESKESAYFLPQHYLLKDLDASAPNAIWILPLRSSATWKKSVQSWLDMEDRMRSLFHSHNPNQPFDLEIFYDSHSQMVRQYCLEHRRADQCVEIQIDDPDAGKVLAKRFPNTTSTCWGKHNVGPFFQVVSQP